MKSVVIEKYKEIVHEKSVSCSKNSFYTMARQLGHDPETFSRRLMQGFQNDLRELLNGDTLDSESESDAKFLLTLDDYWTARTYVVGKWVEQIRFRFIRLLEMYPAYLPVSRAYLGELLWTVYAQLELAPELRKAEEWLFATSAFMELHLLPVVVQFGIKFDAFFSSELQSVFHLPAIVISQRFFDAMAGFIHNVTWALLYYQPESGSFGVLETGDILRKVNDHPEAFLLSNLETCLLGVLDRPVDPGSTRLKEEELQADVTRISTLAISFVVYHEYGHAVMGHIRQEYSKHLEYAADGYAYIALSLEFGKESKKHLMFAVTLVMFLLHFREVVSDIQDEHYPSAIQRLQNIMKAELGKQHVEFARNAWSKMTDLVIDNIPAYKHLSKDRFGL
jgi:hypothetical protein